MHQPINNKNTFVVDLLTTLRRERFSPIAWWHFIVCSWHMSCETARNNPVLKRSWLRITLLMSSLFLFICCLIGVFEGPVPLLRLFPGFVLCVVWQQSDSFWHLGLNRQVQTDKLLPTLGLANILTGLRGLAASFLLGRLIGGLITPIWLVLVVFLFGVVTDILDGQIARKTQTQSKFGQLIDGEVDFCLYLALSIILVQDAVLPLWLGLVLVLRFCIPLVGAVASYFLFARAVRFGSTIWGKCAGVLQGLYFLVLFAPSQLTFFAHLVSFPLLIALLICTFAAPLAQIVVNIHVRREV